MYSLINSLDRCQERKNIRQFKSVIDHYKNTKANKRNIECNIIPLKCNLEALPTP